jgi:hypothetical protein
MNSEFDNLLMECPDVTYHGLEKWFQMMMEKLGWMVLASNKMTGAEQKHSREKIEQYKNSIEHFITKAETKMACTYEKDRQNDLLVLIKHATTLNRFLGTNPYATLQRPGISTSTDMSGGAKKKRGTKKSSKTMAKTTMKKGSKKGSKKN